MGLTGEIHSHLPGFADGAYLMNEEKCLVLNATTLDFEAKEPCPEARGICKFALGIF